MGISTFIILKNEAATLMDSLACAARFSDEIVIGIDDATSDHSLDVIGEWLSSFEGKVEIFEFEWNDDFAEARNRAISKCTEDWIFQLDAHEHLRPGDEEKIVKLTETLPDDVWLVSFEMWDEWSDGIPDSRFFQDQLWRAGKWIVYTGAMHNCISRECCPPEHRVRVPGIVIYHKRTPENEAARKVQRLDMAKKNFLPKIVKDKADLRSVFYLAQSFLNSGILDKAEKYYLMYLERSALQGIPQPGEHSWAFYKAGMIALARNKYDLALDRFFQGLKHRSDSPEIFYAIGEAFVLMDKKREAERFLIIAANTPPAEDHLFCYGTATGHGPWLRLMQLYYGEEKYAAAFRAGMEGLKRSPENRQLIDGVRASLTAASEKIESLDKSKKNLYIINSKHSLEHGLLDLWRERFNTIIHNRVDYAYMKWADIAFINGCGRELLEASQHKFGCKLITRVSRRESFLPYLRYINWDNVHSLVFSFEETRKAVTKVIEEISA